MKSRILNLQRTSDRFHHAAELSVFESVQAMVRDYNRVTIPLRASLTYFFSEILKSQYFSLEEKLLELELVEDVILARRAGTDTIIFTITMQH
jgi:hypothetical protein